MKSRTNISWALAGILLFVAGLGIGAYYSNEILVYFLPFDKGEYPRQSGGEGVVVSDTDTFLKMSLLEQPLPLIFSDTLDEPVIQELLREGAVVLPLGTNFGEPGNVVVTAHSTGTTSFGPYRFAFAKLSELEEGQEFSVKTGGAVYTYKVFGSEIVWPHEVDKLPNDDRSTVTLVTCWPLWTNFKRLLVHGELVNTAYN